MFRFVSSVSYAPMTHKERIVKYFSEIAVRYDLVNHVLSFHCDRLWRRKLVRLAEFEPGMTLMDLCTGTGDLLVAANRVCPECRLTGLDLTQAMLDLAQVKMAKAGIEGELVCGDAVSVPCPDQTYDRVTIGFGLRNFEDPMAGLVEMHRILKPGARVLILEFAPAPKGLFGAVYGVYLRYIIPVLGGLITGSRQAYSHLSTSIEGFFAPSHMVQAMGKAGFQTIQAVPLSGGIAYIYIGTA
jgi:demethylmenaquinone methyltransferase/2-methoxy-6-polyprenyl-1,4-benzoquinol methylase